MMLDGLRRRACRRARNEGSGARVRCASPRAGVTGRGGGSPISLRSYRLRRDANGRRPVGPPEGCGGWQTPTCARSVKQRGSAHCFRPSFPLDGYICEGMTRVSGYRAETSSYPLNRSPSPLCDLRHEPPFGQPMVRKAQGLFVPSGIRGGAPVGLFGLDGCGRLSDHGVGLHDGR